MLHLTITPFIYYQRIIRSSGVLGHSIQKNQNGPFLDILYGRKGELFNIFVEVL
jgi:hypothetical protein